MISATIIADSISSVNGKRITTFEVEFPRYILAEWNTHRVFSRNAASTRAIPIMKQLELIASQPAMPIFYGKNQTGMSAREELDADSKEACEAVILDMLQYVSKGVDLLNSLGLHKQHAGRYLEPWMHVKGVVTSTEWDNFFWLRRDEDAQPEIKQLADCMWDALQESKPFKLFPGEWHAPYVKTLRNFSGRIVYAIENAKEWDDDCFVDIDTNIAYREIIQEQALAISSSCCAQISYRKLDGSLEKAEDIYSKLVSGRKVHASPFENQATPMKEENLTVFGHCNEADNPTSWQEGVTHMDKDYNLWSNNFQGWIQYRSIIPNNVCNKYAP